MRYQSTPEKEFDGDIIITDPCYIIRNENGITKNDWHYCEYGEYMERLAVGAVLCRCRSCICISAA